MGYVADRWHKSRPAKGDPECGKHKGLVASQAHGKGKRWQARYDGPDGNEITSLWATKTEAEAEIIKQESAKQTGSWIDPKAGKVTVKKFALETWLPAQNVLSRTREKYQGSLERYLFPEWGNREMRSIKPSEAGAWQQKLTSKYNLSGGYPHRVATHVRSVFRLAVIDRVIVLSPFDGINAPAIGESVVHPPDVVEVRHMVAAAYKPLWGAMIEVAAMTGLRSGELRGLTVDQIDFLRKTIRVDRQLVKEKGQPLYLDEVKTASGVRIVPLPQRAVDVLAAWIAANPPARSGDLAGLVFTMPDKTAVRPSTLDWSIKRICELAGLQERHWHELRHHYASVLIAGGENPKVVQRRLGHKDVVTTLRTYAHLFAEADERTRDVLEAAWAEESLAVGGTIPESRGEVVALAQVIS